ncbi:MAG TPA: 4Fe-4S dicluster domain-containing protein, partial [Thermotogota bacterium]|nr:4Fe-4S dicluster domain-containing protein [Thermotogota bacterium]
FVKKDWKVTVLKVMLLVYVVMAVLIASFNYALAPGADEATRKLVQGLWHFYENGFKFGFMVVGSLLTLSILKKPAPGRSKIRYWNLLALNLSALVMHIILPGILGNPELYFFGMPLPWTTSGFQLLYHGEAFGISYIDVYGPVGLTAAVVFFVCYNVFVFIGTLLLGRRFQCSMLCLFSGFICEIFDAGSPVFGKKRTAESSRTTLFLAIVRQLFLWIALFLAGAWIWLLLSSRGAGWASPLEIVETVKYLAFELFAAMLFWVLFNPRTYCRYCPSGTVLGWMGKKVGQKIRTELTHCISCGLCTRACPMHLDVARAAMQKKPLVSSRCVGCGHCVQACPTGNLAYSTTFLQWRERKKSAETLSSS